MALVPLIITVLFIQSTNSQFSFSGTQYSTSQFSSHSDGFGGVSHFSSNTGGFGSSNGMNQFFSSMSSMPVMNPNYNIYNTSAVPAFGGHIESTYLYRRGLAIVIFGPYRYSKIYNIKYYVSVNDAFTDIKNAQFSGSVRILQNHRILIIVPAKVEFMDKVYFRMEITGRADGQNWTQTVPGQFSIRAIKPHTDPSLTQEVLISKAKYNQHAAFTLLQNDVKITLLGMTHSGVVRLTWYANVNKEFSATSGYMYSGKEFVPPGSEWGFTVRGLRVVYYDTVYFSIDAEEMATGKKIPITGFYQFPRDTDRAEAEKVEPNDSDVMERGIVFQENNELQQEKLTITEEGSTRTGEPTTTTSSTTTEKPCQPSSTTYNNGRRPCVNEPLDDSLFTFTDENQIAGTDPEDTFTVFSPDNVINKEDQFSSVKTSLLEAKYGPYFVDRNLTLTSCTSRNPSLCSRRASGYQILPPVVAGRRNTKHSFSFRYGKLEITAKLPSGDWIVPELWLVPKNRVYGNNSGKIVVALSRGNKEAFDGVVDHGSRVLEAGVVLGSDKLQLFRLEQSQPWSDDFHTYKLLWTPDQLVFSVDGKEIGRITPGPEGLEPSLGGTKLAPFDQEFYLVYGIHVAGNRDFSDTIINKPWINYEPKALLKFWRSKQRWHPSWNETSALRISNIKFTSLNV